MFSTCIVIHRKRRKEGEHDDDDGGMSKRSFFFCFQWVSVLFNIKNILKVFESLLKGNNIKYTYVCIRELHKYQKKSNKCRRNEHPYLWFFSWLTKAYSNE